MLFFRYSVLLRAFIYTHEYNVLTLTNLIIQNKILKPPNPVALINLFNKKQDYWLFDCFSTNVFAHQANYSVQHIPYAHNKKHISLSITL